MEHSIENLARSGNFWRRILKRRRCAAWLGCFQISAQDMLVYTLWLSGSGTELPAINNGLDADAQALVESMYALHCGSVVLVQLLLVEKRPNAAA